MFSELTVVIKDDEKKLSLKFPLYDSYSISEQDPTIMQCIGTALKQFEGDPTDIDVKIKMSVK